VITFGVDKDSLVESGGLGDDSLEHSEVRPGMFLWSRRSLVVFDIGLQFAHTSGSI
jgi:hypothetical protein